jgi:hypothetical protein
MRTILIPLLLLIPPTLHAQLTAGGVPPGTTSYAPGIALSLDSAFTQDSADIELDCDDFMDVQAVLYRGAPEIDGPNSAALHFVDTDIEVCMDMASGIQQRPRYYNFGEVLECTGGFSWQVADELILGDFGGFGSIGPIVIDSLYIAYRRGSEMGWMLLSFDVNGNPDVELRIHELLPLCQGPTSVAGHGSPPRPVLFPNPSNGAPIEVRDADPLRSIELVDASGRTLVHYAGPVRTIEAPDVPGVYCVRTQHTDGQWSVTRLVRY